ncbi:MAG: non-canonical purine NTP pyrophosphatase [Acidobacteriota bacterium]
MVFRPPLELLAGTRNSGKVREINEILADLPITLRSLADFHEIPSVKEVGDTYEENSSLKALSYARWTKLPTLADDSGLEVDALNGRPGALSARFAGVSASDSDRTGKLLRALDQHQTQPRTARFVCCLTLAGWNRGENASSTDPIILNVARGELEGHISTAPRGDGGFGYDPVFVPNGYAESLAELPSSVKNSISHRANALAAMRTFLESWLKQT